MPSHTGNDWPSATFLFPIPQMSVGNTKTQPLKMPEIITPDGSLASNDMRKDFCFLKIFRRYWMRLLDRAGQCG